MKTLCTFHVRFRKQSLPLLVRGTQLIMIGSHRLEPMTPRAARFPARFTGELARRQLLRKRDSGLQAAGKGKYPLGRLTATPSRRGLSNTNQRLSVPQQLSGVRCSDIDSRTSMNGRAVHYRQHEGCKDRQGHVDVHDGRAEPLLPVASVMMIISISYTGTSVGLRSGIPKAPWPTGGFTARPQQSA